MATEDTSVETPESTQEVETKETSVQQLEQSVSPKESEQPEPITTAIPTENPSEVDDNRTTEISSEVEDNRSKQRRKVFIGGLSWDTRDDGFYNYFIKFGEIEDSKVMVERTTGLSRGFGFVVFKDEAVAQGILHSKEPLVVDGREVDPQPAIPRDEIPTGTKVNTSTKGERDSNRAGGSSNPASTRRIFVGGIPSEVKQDDFYSHFAQFGKLVEATIITDRNTGRPRGFGFVTFEDERCAEEVLKIGTHFIGEHSFDCKKAVASSSSGSGGSGSRRSHRDDDRRDYRSSRTRDPYYRSGGGYSSSYRDSRGYDNRMPSGPQHYYPSYSGYPPQQYDQSYGRSGPSGYYDGYDPQLQQQAAIPHPNHGSATDSSAYYNNADQSNAGYSSGGSAPQYYYDNRSEYTGQPPPENYDYGGYSNQSQPVSMVPPPYPYQGQAAPEPSYSSTERHYAPSRSSGSSRSRSDHYQPY